MSEELRAAAQALIDSPKPWAKRAEERDRLAAALSQPRQEDGLPSVEAFAAAIQSAYDQHDDHRKRHPGHSGACQDDWPSADRLAPLVRARLTAEGSDERR
jgi:hypothetical protein